jgi:hypothetical protein
MVPPSWVKHKIAVVGCALTLAFGLLAIAGTQVHAATQSEAAASSRVAVVSSAALLQEAITAKPQKTEGPTATKDSYEGCNAGYFCATAEAYPVCAGESCVWPGGDQTLDNYILHGSAYFDHWGECTPTENPGCGIGIHGWANNTGYRVWLEQYQNSGNELCISNQTLVPGNYDGVDVDDAWIYLSSNSSPC